MKQKHEMPETLRVLLAGSIDYAGLFPPAGLSMREAVMNYAAYRKSPDAWALGRFIVPMTRLGEFERQAAEHLAPVGSPWQLSVLASPIIQDDVKGIAYFNMRNSGVAVIDTLEMKAASAEEIRVSASVVPSSITLFVEIPIEIDPEPLITAIADGGVKAKVRTGGVTRDAFPDSAALARFIGLCVANNVPFKATAGLHHPIRSLYNLTYQPNSEQGKMFGYLNLFLAAALLQQGGSMEDAIALLEEENPELLMFKKDALSWRSHRITLEAATRLRQQSVLSFGSCSFREPVDELGRLFW